MDKLQKEKSDSKTQQPHTCSYYGGQHQPRIYYGQQQRGGYYDEYQWSRERNREYRGRGRSSYTPRRPLTSNSFMRPCYICNDRGHLARDYPKNTQLIKHLKG